MSKHEYLNILLIFIAWKLFIYVSVNLSQIFFPLQTTFLGGGLLNYLNLPALWGFINFDGEHYLSIARDGYLPLTYFYFPLYPLIVRAISGVFGGSYNTFAATGLTLSNLLMFISIMGIIKLGKLMYSEKVSYLTLILLLFFPASFFLGAYYNESLFLALCIWSFYFAHTKKWLFSFLLCGMATATRLTGIALIPALLYEYFLVHKKSFLNIKTFIYTVISSSGILLYMTYLKQTTGDMLAFFHNVEIFGGQRSTNLISLPQVFYRYIFKILPNVNYDYFPAVAVTLLEISIAVIFLYLLVRVLFKKKYGFFIYSFLVYIIPTLSGSFSSFPRYMLAAFPLFFILAEDLIKANKYILYAYLLINLVLLTLITGLYFRGYFVS